MLGHLPPEQHAPLLRRIARWLRPEGVLLINMPVGAGDSIEPDWLGVSMYFGGLDGADTIAALSAAGLTTETAETIREHEHGHGAVEFLWITASKAHLQVVPLNLGRRDFRSARNAKAGSR